MISVTEVACLFYSEEDYCLKSRMCVGVTFMVEWNFIVVGDSSHNYSDGEWAIEVSPHK